MSLSFIRGKTVFLSLDFWRESAEELVTTFGGKLVNEITPELDFLVITSPEHDASHEHQRRVAELGEAGEPIEIIARQDFINLFTPTREEALAMLRGGEEGLARWRICRGDSVDTWLDLSGVDLSGASLTQIVLYRIKFDGSNFAGADLTRTSIGELTQVNLDGAKLQEGAIYKMTDCSARGADFTDTRFNPAEFVRVDFSEANLTRAEGSYTRSENLIFRGAELTATSFDDSQLTNAIFDQAKMCRIRLNDCDLTGASFHNADLTQASLTRAKLIGADLTGANLTDANLAGADLTDAKVDRADFQGTRLYAAKTDELGDGQPIHFSPPPPVPRERVGPHLRKLEDEWRRTGQLETSLHIKVDEDFDQLCIWYGGKDKVRGFSNGLENVAGIQCQATTLSEAMLELAQIHPGGELCLETLGLSSGEDSKGLGELVLAAWHEAFGIPLPSMDQRKALQTQRRERFINMLRGGPEGIQQWNAIRSEELQRAGHFRRTNLAGCDLSQARLGHHLGSRFQGLDFSGSDFSKANLTDATFGDCNLVNACFAGAMMKDARCAGANLRDADFQGAQLEQCNLRATRCLRTNFSGAILRFVDFAHADLRATDFSAATLDGIELEDAKYDSTTKFPATFDPSSRPRLHIPQVGSRVRVREGTFANFEGEVVSVVEQTVTLRLIVFGRVPELELEPWQLEVLDNV